MKKLTILCLIVLLTLATVLCMTACNIGTTVTYEISVDTKNVSVDVSAIKVCLYAMDGTAVKETGLTNGKAKFQLKAGSYVATVSGLDETVSFSSVMLTRNSRKATITVSNSDCDEFDEFYSYAFTIIVLSGSYKLSELTAQICDLDLMCVGEDFANGNVVDFVTNGGECSVEIFDRDNQEIFKETFTVDLDMRFYIIRL